MLEVKLKLREPKDTFEKSACKLRKKLIKSLFVWSERDSGVILLHTALFCSYTCTIMGFIIGKPFLCPGISLYTLQINI